MEKRRNNRGVILSNEAEKRGLRNGANGMTGRKTSFAKLLLLASLCLPVAARADNAAPQAKIEPKAIEFFETQVRPLLYNKCFSCHGEKQQSGGVRLDSRDAMLKGGGSTVLTPGEPEKSSLVTVTHYDGAVKMPPTGKLKPEEIAALTEWVKNGAVWPEKAGAAAAPDSRLKHWAFQPVKKVPAPKVANTAWNQNPIDAFIFTKLAAKKLAPSPPADKRILLRRVTFDLTGLPPTPAEMNAFVKDKSPDAYAKVVDRLLASPRYGERWGRHWLDVARYADTKGYTFQEDTNFYNAYTYRDYVVRSLNEDLPYDQFLIQQLAADKLPQTDDRRPLAALGYLTLGRRFLNQQQLIVDDQIDATCRGMMGLTVACARCHDHKFDPIPTKDYYSLYGVFASAREPKTPWIISPKPIREPYEAYQKKREDISDAFNALIRAQVKRLRDIAAKTPNDLPKDIPAVLQSFREFEMPTDEKRSKLLPAFEPDAQNRLKALSASMQVLEKNPPAKPEFAVALEDDPHPYDPHVFKRGNDSAWGDAVPRQFLAVLSGSDRKPFSQGSGRLELAQAIANRNNPLTARVLVNRVWMYHFGAGIVRTPGDFGLRGERPTHPELPDFLAARFMDEGWSLKKLHRWILLSQTYRQVSDNRPDASVVDPENRLLWRQNSQRLDFEALRDSLLASAGQLDETVGGPAVSLTDAAYTKRRALYGYIERQNLPGLFRTFDFPTPDASSAQRYHTTTPQQALFMMNSPFALDQAKALTNRKELIHADSDAQRIRILYRLLYNRAPDADEVKLGVGFIRAVGAAQAVFTPFWQYGYGGFDAGIGPVAFTPFAKFAKDRWQVGEKFPDPALGFIALTADGGHPGRDANHAAIRRWTAPQDATIAIAGTLHHPSDQGDGVQARIVSSRSGELGHWTAQHSQTQTEVAQVAVKRGETLDFIVDCRASDNSDSFAWSPILKTVPASGVKTAANNAEPTQTWSASSDFGGPETQSMKTLSAWEKYAHVLLMTNEFCFID